MLSTSPCESRYSGAVGDEWPLRANSAIHEARVATEVRLLPVRCEAGTQTPRSRSENSSSSTSAKESIPAFASGVCLSKSAPPATKFVRANWQSCSVIVLESFYGVIGGLSV